MSFRRRNKTDLRRTKKELESKQDEFKKRLRVLQQQPANKKCIDCDAIAPRWASITLGIFICMRCAGHHRNMGVHISFVRSTTIDNWKEKQVLFMESMGNKKAKSIWEARVPHNYPKPRGSDDRAVKRWIKTKYEYKKFYKAYVEPEPVKEPEPVIEPEPIKEEPVTEPKPDNGLGSIFLGGPTQQEEAPKEEILMEKPTNPLNIFFPTNGGNTVNKGENALNNGQFVFQNNLNQNGGNNGTNQRNIFENTQNGGSNGFNQNLGKNQFNNGGYTRNTGFNGSNTGNNGGQNVGINQFKNGFLTSFGQNQGNIQNVQRNVIGSNQSFFQGSNQMPSNRDAKIMSLFGSPQVSNVYVGGNPGF